MAGERLEELIQHSTFVGQNIDLVQASGGNTSWKTGTVAWIKGSGKRLKDALSEDIFSIVDFGSHSEDEIAALEDFSDLSSNGITPSIEANFHILLKSEFVTHLHSLGAVSIGVSSEETRLKLSNNHIRFIPYARPGVDLAQEICAIDWEQKDSLVLENHGVIFFDSSTSEIERKIQRFENTVKSFFEGIQINPELPDWIKILTGGVLTPDEAVFLGKKPFVVSEISTKESVAVNSLGELLYPQNFSSDRIELANFYVRVAKLIEKKTQVTYLPPDEVESLLGWEKEKIRIAMAKLCS
jgi:rhamnose utilization protein RhaD (predicted bifunctional aldolase and dehydrogenase)